MSHVTGITIALEVRDACAARQSASIQTRDPSVKRCRQDRVKPKSRFHSVRRAEREDEGAGRDTIGKPDLVFRRDRDDDAADAVDSELAVMRSR
jgi:hypothetical protein